MIWNKVNCKLICNGPSDTLFSLLTLQIGNSNLVYTIIRKRNVFHQLANLPTDQASVSKALAKRSKRLSPTPNMDYPDAATMEGAMQAAEAEPGTLKATLLATPGENPKTLHKN